MILSDHRTIDYKQQNIIMFPCQDTSFAWHSFLCFYQFWLAYFLLESGGSFQCTASEVDQWLRTWADGGSTELPSNTGPYRDLSVEETGDGSFVMGCPRDVL